MEYSQLLEAQICLSRRVNGGFRLACSSRYRSLLRNIRLSCPPIIDRLPNFIQLICDIRRKQFLILHLLNILIHLLQLHLIQSIVAFSPLDPIKRVRQINIHLLLLQTLIFGFRPIQSQELSRRSRSLPGGLRQGYLALLPSSDHPFFQLLIHYLSHPCHP